MSSVSVHKPGLAKPQTRHSAGAVTTATMIAGNKGFSQEERELLERWFEGQDRVVEAQESLLVTILPEDAEDAVPCDPERCVYARAVRRCTGSKVCLVYARHAYLERPDEEGTVRLYRYEVSGKGLDRRQEFDETGQATTGVALVLRPSSPSCTLEARRAASAKYREEGKVTPRSGEAGPRRSGGRVIRSGQGQVVTRPTGIEGLVETSLGVGHE